MVKITQDMTDIFSKARPFILATASKDGKPNGVPVGLVRIISDDEIMLVDIFMHKSRLNIEENPWVAVSYWSREDQYGYQFKGKARVETSGKNFDEEIQRLQERKSPFKPRAVVIVKVEEIYYIGAGKDSSIRLDQQVAE